MVRPRRVPGGARPGHPVPHRRLIQGRTLQPRPDHRPPEDHHRPVHRLPELRPGRGAEARRAALRLPHPEGPRLQRGLRHRRGPAGHPRGPLRPRHPRAVRFFFEQVRRINSSFPVLFGTPGEEGEEPRDEGGDPAEAGEAEDPDGAADGFADKWGWVANVDAVSETLRCPWDSVWKMAAIEFLNILSYRRDKAEREKADIEKWKLTH